MLLLKYHGAVRPRNELAAVDGVGHGVWPPHPHGRFAVQTYAGARPAVTGTVAAAGAVWRDVLALAAMVVRARTGVAGGTRPAPNGQGGAGGQKSIVREFFYQEKFQDDRRTKF